MVSPGSQLASLMTDTHAADISEIMQLSNMRSENDVRLQKRKRAYRFIANSTLGLLLPKTLSSIGVNTRGARFLGVSMANRLSGNFLKKE